MDPNLLIIIPTSYTNAKAEIEKTVMIIVFHLMS